MKKLSLISTLLIIILLSCKNVATNNNIKEELVNNENLVEADLFFSWLRIGNFYTLSDSTGMNANAMIDTLAKNNTSSDSSLIVLYRKLNEKDLMFSPYIDVKLEDGTQNTWYINQADYDTIKTFKLKDLMATNSKVHLSAEIEHIYQNAYLCKKISKIELVEDPNYNNIDKFSAGDYK